MDSLVNPYATEGEYQMEKIKPSVTYEIPVRGLVSPDIFSVMAEPLAFEVIYTGLPSFQPLILYLCATSSSHS